MSPTQQSKLKGWMLDLVKHPLEENEVPERALQADAHLNPEAAWRLEASGLPTWWPTKRPTSHQSLSEAERLSSFLEWLEGELSPAPMTALSDDRRLRRQTIALSLLHMQSQVQSGGAPIPG